MLRELLTATFAFAGFVFILEHAGNFSQVANSGVSAWATGFNTLVGHTGTAATTSRRMVTR